MIIDIELEDFEENYMENASNEDQLWSGLMNYSSGAIRIKDDEVNPIQARLNNPKSSQRYPNPESFEELKEWLSLFEGLLWFYSNNDEGERDDEKRETTLKNFKIYYLFELTNASNLCLQRISDDHIDSFVNIHKRYLRILYAKKRELSKSLSDGDLDQVDDLYKLKHIISKEFSREFPEIEPPNSKFSNRAKKLKEEIENEIEAVIEVNPYPHIFVSVDAYNVFMHYVENYVGTNKKLELSCLYHRMKDKSLLNSPNKLGFINFLREKGIISKDEKNVFTSDISNPLESPSKSYGPPNKPNQRYTNFNKSYYLYFSN